MNFRELKYWRVIGYCPRDSGLISNSSGLDNALLYGGLYRLTRKGIKRELLNVQKNLGFLFKDHLKMKASNYGVNMKKEISSTTLLHDPKFLALNELAIGMDLSIGLKCGV